MFGTHRKRRVLAFAGSLLAIAVIAGPLEIKAVANAVQARLTGSAVTPTVSRYAVYEITLPHDQTGLRNPWEEVTVAVAFRSPTRTISVGGFYFGPNTWKARVAPGESGAWTWTATIADPRAVTTVSGKFNVTDGVSPGFVQSNPTNPRRLVTSNGAAFLPIGYGHSLSDDTGNGTPFDEIGFDGRSPSECPSDPRCITVRAQDGSVRWSGWVTDLDTKLTAFNKAGFNLYRWSVDNAAFKLWDKIEPDGNVYLEREGRWGDELVAGLRKHDIRVFMTFLGFNAPFADGHGAADATNDAGTVAPGPPAGAPHDGSAHPDGAAPHGPVALHDNPAAHDGVPTHDHQLAPPTPRPTVHHDPHGVGATPSVSGLPHAASPHGQASPPSTPSAAGATTTAASTSTPRVNSTSSRGLDAVKRYARYVVDRYGAYVDFWELMNEVGNVSDSYVNELAAAVRERDPYQHKISTSWERPKLAAIELNTPHWYANEDELTSDDLTRNMAMSAGRFGKPVIFGEQGNNPGNGSWDPGSARRYRLRSWSALFNEASLISWDYSATKESGSGVGIGALYIGPEERGYTAVLSRFQTSVGADASRTGVTVSSNLRGYGMTGARAAWAYVVNAVDHRSTTRDGRLVITAPISGTATFISPADGSVLGSTPVTTGSNQLTLPPFVTDIAVRIA